MSWTKINVSTRKVILSIAFTGLAAAGLIIGAQFNSTDAMSASSFAVAVTPSATFPANAGSLGAVADGPAACNAYGAARDVTFNVSGIGGTISNVAVNFSMSPSHSWVGDLDVRLIAPGGSPEHIIISRTGAATATAAGDSSDVSGPYTFGDASPATPTWWQAAAAEATGAAPVPPGSYRTSTAGEVAGGGVNTLITPTFAALGAAANGTWTLRFRDHCSGDTGSVSAANLTIDAAAVGSDAPVDYDGDSRSDFVTVRNVGGGTMGQVRWSIGRSSDGLLQGYDWGLATDFFVSEDFDGDLKDDITVWRPGSATVAAFYILNSQTSTVRVEAFGQTGDDPTIVADYNNDGRADLAVYRSGAASGQQSTWFYRTTANGPVNFVPWGTNGDFPAPGDYDGDGSADFVVQRNFGGGQAAFWRNLTTAPDDIVVFGAPTDVIVPGDYDDDGKTDLATIRAIGGTITWFYRPSGGGADQQVPWGNSLTDFPTQGDYDGDGRTDQAIWRNGTFWVRNGASGAFSTYNLGTGGDYPVANYNTH
jgi:subtilisin-like proprotein convertase family protein